MFGSGSAASMSSFKFPANNTTQNGGGFGTTPQNNSGFGNTTQPASGGFGNTGSSFSLGAPAKPLQRSLSGGLPTTGSGGLFGANNTSNTGTSGGLFGTAGGSAAPTGGLFGNNNANSQTGSGLFGGAATKAAPSGGLFGGNTAASQPSTGLFGSNTAASQPSTGLFGSNTAASQPSTGLFGSNTAASQPSTGLFGSNTAASQPSTGLFGSNTAGSQPSTGLFGSNTATTQPATGGLFGATTTANQPPAGGLFGNSTATSQPSSGGLFGTTATATNQPSTGLFGAKTTTPSGLFGTSTTNTTQSPSLFNSSPSNSLFNTSQNLQQQPSNLSQPSLFASIDQPSYSLPGTPTSNISLGPLTSPRPDSTKRRGSSSLKASSPNRLLLSSARNSPYRKEISRSRSELNLGGILRGGSNLRKEMSIDDFNSVRLNDTPAGIKKLIINKNSTTLESLLGRRERNKIDKIDKEKLNDKRENGRIMPRSQTDFNLHSNLRSTSRSELRSNGFSLSENRSNGEVTQSQQQQSKSTPLTSNEAGYWISPSLQDLNKLSYQQLQHVDNLSIGRYGYGQLTYCSPVDLTDIDLSEILGRLVIFGPGTVCVYPDVNQKSKEGTKLNIPAVVSLEKIFPINRKTGQVITDPVDVRVRSYGAKLRNAVTAKGGDFLSYNVDNGVWIFKVPHFSVWGVPDDDDDDDLEEYEDIENVAPDGYRYESVGEMGEVGDIFIGDREGGIYDFGYQNGEDIDIEELEVRQVPEGSWGAIQLPDQSLAAASGGASQQQHTSSWGIPDINNYYYEEQSDLIDENQKIDSLNLNTNHNRQPSDNTNPDPPTDLQPILPQQEEFQARNWNEQLEYSSRIDSPFSYSKPSKPIENFNSFDIDNILYGGINSLKDSSTSQYEKAAKELRLPTMFTKSSFARFSPGCEKLLIKGKCNMLLSDIPEQTSSASHSIISNLIDKQIGMSTIKERSNGLPLFTPTKQLTMKFLSIHSNPSSQQEKELFELASILFDDIYSIGLENIDQELDLHVQERIKEQYRRKLLSNWLQNVIIKGDNTNSNNNNQLDNIIDKISCNLLQDACNIAIKSNNFHLATIIPLLGCDDSQIRQDALMQLEDWKVSKSIFHIPIQIRKIYELLSGNTTISKPIQIGNESCPTLHLSDGLDWLKSFGLRLWYESNKRTSIPEVVESYKQAFEVDSNKVAKPFISSSSSSSSKYDIRYLLLRLYGSMNPSLKSVLEPINGIFNFREPWYIYLVLVHSGLFSDINSQIGDKLTTNFGCQLENMGLWVESIFVFSHLTNDRGAETHIQRVISHHINDIQNDSKIKAKLINQFKIPEHSLLSSKALLCRYQHDYLEESINLIQAQLYEEAHKTIITKVAPKAVIEDRPNKITDLLTQIKYPESIFSWNIGGQLYLDYGNFINLIQQRAPKEKISTLAFRLAKSLSNINIPKTNSDIKVAVSLMSKIVAKYGSNYLDGSTILSMKMNKSSYYNTTASLSVQYFKEKLQL